MSGLMGENGGNGGQQQMALVVALCCFCSMAVALFLWYAYNNQDKFTWLDWFFKLFRKGEASPPSPAPSPAPSPDTPGTLWPETQPEMPGGGDAGGGSKPGKQDKPCSKRGCNKGAKPRMKSKKCEVCKKNKGGCYQWKRASESRCNKKSGFTPLAPLAAYDSPFDVSFKAYTAVPSYQPPALAVPVAYNERF